MKRRLARLGTGLAALALTAGVVEVLPAGAVPPAVVCGQTITQDTVLQADIGPCPSPGPGYGLNIGADNITLDLNGHRVFGANVPGEGPGIRLFKRLGVKVKNGTVDHFDCGVAIEGGNGNTITAITAEDNVGRNPGSVCGEGVAILSSTGNIIEQSTMRRNAPFAGIGVYSLIDSDHPRATAGVSSGNNIRFNQVYDNLGGRDPNSPNDTDNDGIRMEPNSSSNSITNNTVRNNGLDGIALFAGSGGNRLLNNTVENNGHRTSARRGSGIIVFNRANGNLIQGNIVRGNSDNGIVTQGPVGSNPGAGGSRILYNTAYGNSALPSLNPTPGGAFGGPTFDLNDRNGNCSLNQWYGNEYGTAAPECTKAGGTQHINTV